MVYLKKRQEKTEKVREVREGVVREGLNDKESKRNKAVAHADMLRTTGQGSEIESLPRAWMGPLWLEWRRHWREYQRWVLESLRGPDREGFFSEHCSKFCFNSEQGGN